MSTISINGATITGRNITIRNNKIIVDGKDVTPDAKTIDIKVEGNIETLEVDACDTVTVSGSIGKIKTMRGNVKVAGNVKGDIQTMSGDVECGEVSGSINTMSGDVKHKAK